ncbi:MAG: archease [Nitrospirae bacterium]|jgi:SHS2 domain-containing protein|nr:archease [Nitrospirota bacterium]
MERFQLLDISGDAGIRAFGKSIEEAFINASLGMYSLITNLDEIEKKNTINVMTESDSLEGLLVSWLNELIFHFDAYGFIGKKIIINEFTPSFTLPPRGGGRGGGEAYKVKASVSGEDFDPERHESKLLIKAATYHMLRIEKIDDKWEINVIFDI